MVSTDPPERNESFSRDVGDGFPVLSDTTGKAARAFGVVDDARVVPRRWTFYVDAEGIIREIDKSVATETAGTDIARRLDALGFPRKP
jgi:peroxiredoxin Q/BCP